MSNEQIDYDTMISQLGAAIAIWQRDREAKFLEVLSAPSIGHKSIDKLAAIDKRLKYCKKLRDELYERRKVQSGGRPRGK